jgi:DNA-binding GntR family transcriptional regulator
MSSEASEHLYERIAAWLRKQILTGSLAPGERLPTRDDLGARFSTSETTVRQALGLLEAEGLITRGRGAAPTVRPRTSSRPGEDEEPEDFTRACQDPNPIRRAQRATALIETYRRRMVELARVRREAIEQAHDGQMTYTEIAEALGVTKGRITQIRSQSTPRP